MSAAIAPSAAHDHGLRIQDAIDRAGVALREGQRATVLQLPVLARLEAEIEATTPKLVPENDPSEPADTLIR